jgi:4-carboxymuconolactone decarboxylase
MNKRAKPKSDRPSEQYRSAAPRLAEMAQSVLAETWERTQLSKRERCLITCAVLTALYRPVQLPFHMQRALDTGVTKEELGEVISHVALYAGFPAAVSAALIATELFEKTDG